MWWLVLWVWIGGNLASLALLSIAYTIGEWRERRSKALQGLSGNKAGI
jgi:hypothetical protein